MLKIIDNSLNDSLLISIQENIESEFMPWYFLKNSAVTDDKELVKQNRLNYSFYHKVLDKGNPNEVFSPHILDMTNSIGLILKDLFELEKTYNVVRLRWGMTTTLNKIHKHDPHTDIRIPHKVILFYLNDTDGDTYFYDKKHKIIDSVTPKENRAVLFDGLILHSSSKPIEFAKRIVLNINLMKEQNDKESEIRTQTDESKTYSQDYGRTT